MDENKNGITWAVSSHIRATTGPDGGVLLDIEKGLCYSLNLVGAQIWLGIESARGTATLEHIVVLLQHQFTVPREQLVGDIKEYLQDLEKNGLIKSNGRGSTPKGSLRQFR
jgi:Coenzyme PQQ synthesis protein D (PqqD)